MLSTQNQTVPGLSADLILYPPRVLSGVQPTPAVHLGHYFGALKQHTELQHEYPGQAFFLIADYHALTRSRDPVEAWESTLELACAYLAFGLDPNKAVLYRQSDVPQGLELFWILSCFATTGDLERVPTYKAATENGVDKTAALLTYPVLMAADILSLRATIVPVGYDQRINIEQVRDIARRFNAAYDTDIFPLPIMRLGQMAVIRGTDGRKMSHAYNNVILPFEPYNRLHRRVLAIKTDSAARYAPKDPDNCNVFHLYSLVASEEKTRQMRHKYEDGAISYEEAKRELTFAIMESFAEAAERYDEYKKRPDFIKDMFREGFKQAAEQIEITVETVRQIIGLAI